MPLLQGGMLVLCQPIRDSKRQDSTTPDRFPCKEQLDSSGQWIADSLLWNGILHSLTPFLLLLLILLIAPFFYKLISIQRISNQTFYQLLLQEHQPLTTGPEAYDTPNCALTMKTKVAPMDFSTLIQQEVV